MMSIHIHWRLSIIVAIIVVIIDYSGVFIYAEYTYINFILCYTNLHETYK